MVKYKLRSETVDLEVITKIAIKKNNSAGMPKKWMDIEFPERLKL